MALFLELKARQYTASNIFLGLIIGDTFSQKYTNNIIFLLMERNKKKKPWAQQQIDLLQKLYPHQGSKKWKKISQGLKDLGYRRSQIEIRERWINFLDPSLNKANWQEWQLEKLYDIHDQVGTKWCVIQKFLGRTQNMIKNRFYGTLRNFVRFLVNYFNPQRESYNYRISMLSPKILNDIYKAENRFKFLGEEIKEAIYQMRFKIDKRILLERIKAKRSLYEKLRMVVATIFDIMKSHSYESFSCESEDASEDDSVKYEDTIKEEHKVENDGDHSQPSNSMCKQNIKMESLEQVYPFLEKEGADITYKLEDEPYYPFLAYSPSINFDLLYRPFSTNCQL